MLRRALIIAVLFLVMFSVQSLGGIRQTEHRYYFFVSGFGEQTATLRLVGINDSTSYVLYSLQQGGLVVEEVVSGVINRMQIVDLANLSLGHYMLKTSNRITAILIETGSLQSTLFFPSASGVMAGTEFIVSPLSARETAPTAIAYEDAVIRVYDSKGKKIQEVSIGQNKTAGLSMATGVAYRVVSTGRIALMQIESHSMAMAVGSRGYHKDRLYITHLYSNNPAAIIPYKPCKVVVYDARTGSKIKEKTFTDADVEKGAYWYFNTRSSQTPYKIEASANVTVFLSFCTGLRVCHPEEGEGIAVFGVRAGDELRFYIPEEGGAVIFSPFEATVVVDGMRTETAANQYLEVSSTGVHIVKSTAPIIIEVYRGFSGATSLISDVDAGALLPPPKPGKKTGGGAGGFGFELIAAVIAAVVAAALAVYMMRRRS